MYIYEPYFLPRGSGGCFAIWEIIGQVNKRTTALHKDFVDYATSN